MEDDEAVRKAKEFLEAYYSTQLVENRRKELYSLDIDFRLLAEFNIELANDVLEQFENAFTIFRFALEQLGDEEDHPITPRFFNLSQSCEKDIWKLRSKDVKSLVIIKGYIRKIGVVLHAIKEASFECGGCGNIIKVLMEDEYKEVTKCGCGRKGKFKLVSKDYVDIQKMVIEEDPMAIKLPQTPRTMLAILKGDLCRSDIDKTLQPSRKIIISGLIKDKPIKPPVNMYENYMEVNSIQVIEEGISTIKITEEDIKRFREIVESPTIYEDLAQSIIPNIRGHDAAKLGILYQLMGGVSLYKDGQLEERDLIHILMVSSPGQGKSKILNRAASFMLGSIVTGGKGVSGCGLIGTVSKDEQLGGWVLEAGSVPRASGAMNCIDECDKISKSDIAYLNSAMMEKKIRIDKASIHCELQCDTIILAAANPTNRVFERNKLIWEQIGLPKDFLDRFDLIFIIQSGDKEEEKKKVADLVVGKYREESKEANPIYTHDLVVKFIAYARQNCKPKMTKEVQEYIVQNFLNIVKPIGKEEDTGYFSYRLLTNIIRLSQAVAKVRLVKEVINGNPNQDIIEEDAKRAINLLIESLKQQDIITMDNLFDYERAEAITPKKKRDAMRIIKQIIRDLQETPGIPEKLADYEDIKKHAIEASIDSDTLDEMIELLKRPGEILEIRRDKFQLQ